METTTKLLLFPLALAAACGGAAQPHERQEGRDAQGARLHAPSVRDPRSITAQPPPDGGAAEDAAPRAPDSAPDAMADAVAAPDATPVPDAFPWLYVGLGQPCGSGARKCKLLDEEFAARAEALGREIFCDTRVGAQRCVILDCHQLCDGASQEYACVAYADSEACVRRPPPTRR